MRDGRVEQLVRESCNLPGEPERSRQLPLVERGRRALEGVRAVPLDLSPGKGRRADSLILVSDQSEAGCRAAPAPGGAPVDQRLPLPVHEVLRLVHDHQQGAAAELGPLQSSRGRSRDLAPQLQPEAGAKLRRDPHPLWATAKLSDELIQRRIVGVERILLVHVEA